MEWDVLVGPMYRPMLTLTRVPSIRCGHGGVAGDEAGVVAGVVVEAVGSAGDGLHLTGTRGGRKENRNF
jgi:hypothetical protein